MIARWTFHRLRRTFSLRKTSACPLDVDVLAVYPHAHYLGKVLEGFATLPDGSRQPLIRIPEWNIAVAGRLSVSEAALPAEGHGRIDALSL